MTDTPIQGAYWEAAHQPLHAQAWTQKRLLEAARKSKCRNTGWPIGVVLTSPEHAPKPRADGIEVTIRGPDEGYDYWSLSTQGAFYFLRRLEEDVRDVKPKGALFFDTRIWRVAEIFLHCSRLYRELELPLKSQINVYISHHGLDGRILAASNSDRMMTLNRRKCTESSSNWHGAVMLDSIESELETHVKSVLAPVFMLFDFWEPADSVWKSVIDEFLASHVS